MSWELGQLRKHTYFYIMERVTDNVDDYLGKYLDEQYQIWSNAQDHRSAIYGRQEISMDILKSWVHLDQIDKFEQELLTIRQKYPEASIQQILGMHPQSDSYIIAFMARDNPHVLENGLTKYRLDSTKHVEKPRVNQNIVDTINRVTNWWFSTEYRVEITKMYPDVVLTLRPITSNDLIIDLQRRYGHYYGNRIHDIIGEHMSLIRETVSRVNERVKVELAKINDWVNTQIQKIIADGSGKPITQRSFITQILIPKDVEIWCTELNQQHEDSVKSFATKPNVTRVMRSQLWDILDRHKYNYGTKSISEWYNDYIAQWKDKNKQIPKSKRPDAVRLPNTREDVIAYPWKSKIGKYRRQNPNVKVEYTKIPTIERIPEKQLYRPYFSSDTGGWEIDFAFKICNDKDKSETEENIVDTWLFCINVNTRYLEVYKCPKKDVKSVIDSLYDLGMKHKVTSIRGDGESSFNSVSQYIQLKREVMTLTNDRSAIAPPDRRGPKYAKIINDLETKASELERKRKNLKSQDHVEKLNEIAQSNISFMWMDSAFTNHNRIVDCVIKTIRNAIGYRNIKEEQLLQIVDYYNNTYHLI